MIYHDHALPGLHGQYFVCEPAGNLIHRAVIESDGPVLKVRRENGEQKSEFAASTDAWSHPMNLTHGRMARFGSSIIIARLLRITLHSAPPSAAIRSIYGHDRGRIYRLNAS
jgi:hypothetical protein